VIFITRSSDDIPFDLKHHQHIVYTDGIAHLKDKLTARILSHLREMDSLPRPTCNDLDVELYRQKLSVDSIIKVPAGLSNYGAGVLLELEFSLVNPRRIAVDLRNLCISLTSPPTVELGTNAISGKLGRSVSLLPDNRVHVANFHRFGMLPPGATEKFRLDIWIRAKNPDLRSPAKFTLTLEHQSIIRVLPFEILFDPLYRLN
jgi:hypothetical protein